MQDAKARRILIVDDEPDVRFVLKTALQRNGYTTEEAASGVEALEALKGSIPDAILLDVMMPKLDGFSLNQRLKADPRLAGVPVIIMTGKGHMKELFEARKDLTVAAYLEKPFAVAVLIERLVSLWRY
ncbi:MAG: response regulator [Elusimicrobiota bacterium]